MAEAIISKEKVKKTSVILVGIPFDLYSTFMHGPALAPARIREVLHAGATNLCAENGIDLGASRALDDRGDIQVDNQSDSDWIRLIEEQMSTLLETQTPVLTLGGDHAVTYPIIRAYSRKYTALTILQLDAHPDLYDHYEGNRFAHACPFARIMEEKLVGRLIQVGIRTLNPHQQEQAQRFGVEVIEMRHFAPDLLPRIDTPVYVSIDLDVLDPAYAPGVSHHEPGGMSTRQVIEIIHRIEAPIVGADIVEYNPKRDPTETTAMVAVKLLKEITARMIEQAER
ncbi:MAG: agmatinase [Deltaproteobacteria bacterium]|jgi:agmatinase|nr:agmatinase [Deltaproteobacteria bacterium]